jgi:hypothetical protein
MEPYTPKPKEALKELKPLTDVVHDLLLGATDHVLPYFQQRRLPVDRTVSGDMFRYELSRQLTKNFRIIDQNHQELAAKKTQQQWNRMPVRRLDYQGISWD